MSPSDHQREIDDLIQQYFPEPKPEQGNGHHPHNGKPPGLIRRSNGHAGGALSDDAVLDMCRKAKNAAKFAELFDDGDVSGYKSRSDADYALIGILKFYTQDPDQLEALMRLSALKRSKWDTNRGGRSWLRYSIDNALEEVEEAWRGSETNGSGSGSPISIGTGTDADDGPKLVKFRDIERKDRPKDIVQGLVPANSMTLFYGAGGVAKSYVALQLSMAVTGAADNWLGFAVEHGPVVYADFELDASEHGWRSHRLAKGIGLEELPEDLYYMELTARKPRQAFDALYKACVDVGAILLILDSLTVALEGDVEVARDFIGFVNHQVGRLRKRGVATLALDHQGKLQSGERYQQKSAFGTSFKRHLARSYAQLEPRDHGDGFLALTLRHQKQNFAPLVDPFGVRVEFEQNQVLVTKEHLDESELAGEETIPARERVYKAIKAFEDEEGTKSDVVEATGLAEGTVKKELAALKRETPPRVWDTGRAEGRQAVVTTKETSGSGSAPIGEPEPEPVIPSREKDEQQPLSSSLKPGESATLEELKKRREQGESSFAKGGHDASEKCIHDVLGGCWLCGEEDSPNERGAHTENFG